MIHPAKTIRMRVFLSYGHQPPENAALVRCVANALRARGHDPWMDTDEIKGDDPWRERIISGLKQSDWTIAFLSRHAVRDPGVCLDELTIALHVKGGMITPVLIEPEDRVIPPHQVDDAQRIDMGDWATRTDGPGWDEWFAAKIDEIDSVLTNPAKQDFADAIALLDGLLLPVEQAADLPPRVRDFVGREWLLEALHERRRGELPHRMIWITGAPGSGKSAFSAWLATRHRTHVIAFNLSDARYAARNEPVRVIRTLAFQLARRIVEYRMHLLDRFARLADPRAGLGGRPNGATALLALSDEGMAALRNRLDAMPPEELFAWLLSEPLHHCIDGGRGADRYLVVLDGLDETLRGEDSPLTTLFAERARYFPDWIAIAATSRPEPPIGRMLAHLPPLPIDLDSRQNRDDLRVYARTWFGSDDPALLDRIIAAAEGSFQYLVTLRQAVKDELMRLDEPAGLPRGLSPIYRRWSECQFPDPVTYDRAWRPVWSVLAAARSAVPITVLDTILAWTPVTRVAARRALGSLVVWTERTVGLSHASLRDWLVREGDEGAGDRFMADAADGAARLTEALWPRLTRLAADPATAALDEFARDELPAQMARLGDAALRAYLPAPDGWDSLAVALIAQIEAAKARYAWPSTLAWLEVMDRLAVLMGSVGVWARWWALDERGDLFTTLGQLPPALEAHQRARAAMAALVEADPGNAQWQRDLSFSHTSIGQTLLRMNEIDAAMGALREALAVDERLAAMMPGSAQAQRDVFVSRAQLAQLSAPIGDIPAARDFAERARTQARLLVERFPDVPRHGRDLAAAEALWRGLDEAAPS